MEIEAFSRIQAYVEQVATYSTKFGVAWIFGTIVFRIMPAIAFMDGVYADDQEVFQCVTTQPGCNQMCFNQFSPILPHRLYLLHITLLMLPIFAFLTWAISFENRSSREENELKMLEVSAAKRFTLTRDDRDFSVSKNETLCLPYLQTLESNFNIVLYYLLPG